MQSKHLIILYELSKKIKFRGAKTFLTTDELGNFLGISQQSASRYLKRLEEQGLIERKITSKGQWIGITEEGILSLKELYQNLGSFLEFKPHHKPILRGEVTKGMDEGSYYVKAYSKKIEQKLGFKPYPGTLNVKLLAPNYSRKELARYAPLKIKKFSGKDRVFGDIKLMPGKIFLKGKEKEDCYLIIPQRTHHREDEIELIHSECLRKKFNLKDGDEIEVKIEVS